MAEQLGKIEKPDSEPFTTKRKLYLVPLLFCGEDAPAEYVEKFNRYWEQVIEHVTTLESKIGKVSHVYHESIAMAGEDGLKVMEKLNPSCHKVITEKCQQGAVMEATEDKEVADEAMDWERFLFIGFISQKVATVVSEFYTEASRKRYEHIAQRIDETLKDSEAGILFIRESHSVQFPQDIEVFSVVPPALDEIRRWQRDRTSATTETTKEDEP